MNAVATLSPPAADANEWPALGDGLAIHAAARTAAAEELLSRPVRRLLVDLHRRLQGERLTLLRARTARQREYDAGAVPGYLDREFPAVAGDWQVAEVPADLRCRRVEITGPVNDTKMVINMLSRNAAGERADTAMLDFEDSMKPLWHHVVAGVHNVVGAATGELRYDRPARGGQPAKLYTLDAADMALPMVRVRGLHLEESNLRIDGVAPAAGLVDFVLCWLHSARHLVDRGMTPAYYVPKTEHYLEARWWNRLFELAQEAIGLPVGTLRATFLIETLPAAFQMEEILYEIRHHAAGLNVGRWDKIFSDIKTLKTHPDRVLADRATIGLERPWMRAYAERLIQVCHRRGAWAIGGMSAFTPGRDPEVRARQTAKVKADKALEASLGHDGCWVSHPYFIGVARAAFERPDQLDVLLEDLDPCPDLLPRGGGPRTLAGLRTNVRVGIAYLAGWQAGLGCVAWDGLMEDLATLEISRAQTWQWLHHGIAVDGGEGGELIVDRQLLGRVFDEELERIRGELEAAGRGAEIPAFEAARDSAEALFARPQFQEFLTRGSELA